MNSLRLLVVFSSFLALAGRSWATSIVPPTLTELVDHASIIAETEVTTTRCELRNSLRGPFIVTIVRAKVLDAVKGSPAEEIEFEQLGGQVGEMRMEVEDLPQWKVGDRDYLFLRQLKGSICPLVGMPHGRYPIFNDGVSRLDQVERANHEPLTSVEDMSRPLSRSPALRAAGARALRSGEFRELVRAEIAKRAGAAK